MIAALLLAAAVAAQTPSQPAAGGQIGAAGVCVRWGADPDHVAEAIVVVSTGDPMLDESIPKTLAQVTLQQPGDDYDGEWVGYNIYIDPMSPRRPLPVCDSLPGPKRLHPDRDSI